MKKILAVLLSLSISVAFSQPAIAADPYSKKWGTFSIQKYSGTGDDVISLPKTLTGGFISANHDGEGNFAIWALDNGLAKNELLVNEIGQYVGSAAFGVSWLGKKTKALEITADGFWSIEIRPLAKAPTLKNSGTGMGVYKVYLKSRPIWKMTHQGDSNFAVWQHCTSGGSDLLVNEIGNYSGKKTGLSGYCIISVDADGAWTLKK